MNLHEQIKTICGPLDGWTTVERCCIMADLIVAKKPLTVVELGVFGGRSLIAQALALEQARCGQIFGIDPWRKAAAVEGENEANVKWWSTIDIELVHRNCMNAIWANGLEGSAIIIRSESQSAYPLFNEPKWIDILNIDANHSEIASCRDVDLYLCRCRKGAHIWFDDCDWASTHKAQEKVKEQCEVVIDEGHWKLYRKK